MADDRSGGHADHQQFQQCDGERTGALLKLKFHHLFIGAVFLLVLIAAASPQIQNPSLPSMTDNGVIVTGTEPLLISNIVDGNAPVTITTGSTAILGGTYRSGYTFNQEGTAATAVTYTLPSAALGLQYCAKNSNNGSAPDTGVLKLQTSAAGQSIIYNGTTGASDGYLISGGAAGDAACVVGISATQWEAYSQVGSWVVH
jgi:hypothetical protein